jgi:hypothetical protein
MHKEHDSILQVPQERFLNFTNITSKQYSNHSFGIPCQGGDDLNDIHQLHGSLCYNPYHTYARPKEGVKFS